MPRREQTDTQEVLYFACIALVFLKMLMCCSGAVQILNTTPIFAIIVDENGNQIPIKGHALFWLGMAGTFLFSVLAFFVAIHVSGD